MNTLISNRKPERRSAFAERLFKTYQLNRSITVYPYVRCFSDAELLDGVTYGGMVLDDIGGQFAGPLLDITLQDPTRSLSRYAPYICRTK